MMWTGSPMVDGPVGPTEGVIHPSSPKDIKHSVKDISSPVVNHVQEQELLNLEQEPNHSCPPESIRILFVPVLTSELPHLFLSWGTIGKNRLYT